MLDYYGLSDVKDELASLGLLPPEKGDASEGSDAAKEDGADKKNAA